MKKVMLMLLALLFFVHRPCKATDHNEELLSIINLNPETITQRAITSMLGAPAKIEESRKRVMWFYSKGKTTMVISWNKKSQLPEKVSFSNEVAGTKTFDNTLSAKLVSGTTDMLEVSKILGTPRDMTIKPNKQEMHYAYQNKVLRLFFRDNKLVDYCLY
jgi:hypothetical protein